MKLHERVIETYVEGNKKAELWFPAHNSKDILDEPVMISKQSLLFEKNNIYTSNPTYSM